jgi:transposase
VLRHRLLDAARSLTGARVLAERLYGVGPVTGLAMTCWLDGAGRFSSSRKAVRFAGLDITVWSSGRKGPPGRLSRQGPPVLRWAVYEVGKTHARASAPDHACYAAVKDRKDGKRAALSEARKILRQACHILAGSGDDALTPPEPRHPVSMVAILAWPGGPASRRRTRQIGHNRGQLPPVRCQPLPVLPRRARRTACID